MEPQLPNLHYYLPAAPLNQTIDADICIYGGIAGGVAAAVQAARMGKKAVIVEFSDHLGGLSSGGLGATDIGNKAAIGGISREFYRRLGQHYGNDENWTFEPSAAEKVLEDFIRENSIPVFRRQHLVKVVKDGTTIREIHMDSGAVFRAKIFLDATYEGDLLAMAGVSFHAGREANRVYHETLNGVRFGHPNHNFHTWVDPYVRPGDPASGLLPEVQNLAPGVMGDGDGCIQAYNFRVCLCADQANQAPFPQPRSYNPARFELLLRYIQTGIWDALKLTINMPNAKTDTNNFGAVSSDLIGGNYDWPTASYARREEIFQDHVNYNVGMYYFLMNDPRIPAHVRADVARWGLPKDEFVGTAHWPHQLYVREARRMISDYVMTEHECRGFRVVSDPCAMAAYGMDSHNCRRIVVNGQVINEGNVETHGFAPYPISYRALAPRRSECTNLLVPTCLSSSHIAYGSIRMEPVFMILGQTAATAAALAIDSGRAVQDIDYPALRARLLADGQLLAWNPPARP